MLLRLRTFAAGLIGRKRKNRFGYCSCSDMKQADIADKFKMSGDSPVSNGTEAFKDCSADKIRSAMFNNDPLTF